MRIHIKSLKNKLLLSYILILALPVLIIGIFSYRKASQTLEDEVKKYSAQVLIHIGNSVDILVDQMSRLALIMNADPEVLAILCHRSAQNSLNDIRDYQKVQQVIQNAIGFVPDIAGFMVFATDGRNFSMNSKSVKLGYDFQKEHWYQQLQQKNSCFLPSHYQNQVIEATSEKVISLVKVIKNTETYETVGYVLIDCKTKALENIVNTQKDLYQCATFILNSDDELIYASNTKICNENTIKNFIKTANVSEDINFLIRRSNHQQVLFSYHISPYTGWKTINVIPIAEINKNIANIKAYTILIVLLSLILTILISYFLAFSITNPLRHLKEKMKAVAKGDFEVSVGIHSEDEIGELGRSFDVMAGKINEMVKKVFQAELVKKEAELRALQAQINPHFLYNTLAVIDGLALADGNQKISEISCALSKIFRYNVENGEESTVEREIEQIQLYLLIQKARYADRLDYTVSIEPALKQCKLMKLLIQPIVENAIVHGLEGKRGPVNVNITVTRTQNQQIVIIVEDNGCGIPAESLEALQQELQSGSVFYWKKEPQGRYHVGLKNVNDRIKACYGEEFGIVIASTYNAGTTVKIIIPKMEAE